MQGLCPTPGCGTGTVAIANEPLRWQLVLPAAVDTMIYTPKRACLYSPSEPVICWRPAAGHQQQLLVYLCVGEFCLQLGKLQCMFSHGMYLFWFQTGVW